MEVNVAGLLVLVTFYILILVIGVIAARKKKLPDGTTQMEQSIVAGRDINSIVGIFTMTATIVGGGYVNGTAESIASSGLVWTLAPFGIFLGLFCGGVVFARKMREQRYLTMLDPCQEVYGEFVVTLVYAASLCGDIFWTASILSALGTSLSVILNIPLNVAIISSASVTIVYTMIGQMVSVAYTDIVQLCLIMFGLTLSVPFVMTNENIGDITNTTEMWIGQFDPDMTSPWLDLFIAMTFGTIPWQSYFQRVLSVQTSRQAQILSIAAGVSALILVIPSILIGAASTSANWNGTSLGMSPLQANVSSMVLPYVLHEFTPTPVAILGLGAISAAVMSSMDSSILGSSSMFTNNIYRQIIRQKATDQELLWVQRVAILCIGVLATVISVTVPIVYGLFILAADIVFVIVLPQLICALFFKWTNSFGAIFGYLLSVILRLGAGETFLKFDPLIIYPFYNENGQVFPFRTFAMIMSLFSILVVSKVTNFLHYYFFPSNSFSLNGPKEGVSNTDLQQSTKKLSFQNYFLKKGKQEEIMSHEMFSVNDSTNSVS